MLKLTTTARVPVLISLLWQFGISPPSSYGDNYPLSAAGDDASDGATPERAWRTIARANRQTLRPGDRLLFRGGDTFEGNLIAKVDGAPSAASPVMIGSFGKGK